MSQFYPPAPGQQQQQQQQAGGPPQFSSPQQARSNFAPPPAGFQSPQHAPQPAPGQFFQPPPMGAPGGFQQPPGAMRAAAPGPPQLAQQFGAMNMGGAPGHAAAPAPAQFQPPMNRPPNAGFAPPPSASSFAPPAAINQPSGGAAPPQFQPLPPALPNRFAQPPMSGAPAPGVQPQQPLQQGNGVGGAPGARPQFGAPPPQFGSPPQFGGAPKPTQFAPPGQFSPPHQQPQQGAHMPAPGQPMQTNPPPSFNNGPPSNLPNRFPAPPPVAVPPPNLAAMQAQQDQVAFNGVGPVRPFDDGAISPMQQQPQHMNGGGFQQQPPHMQQQQQFNRPPLSAGQQAVQEFHQQQHQQQNFGQSPQFAIPPSNAPQQQMQQPQHMQQQQQQPQQQMQNGGNYNPYNQQAQQQQPSMQPPQQQDMYAQQQQQQPYYDDPNMQQGQYNGYGAQSPTITPGGSLKPKRVDRIDPNQIPRRQDLGGSVKYHTRSMLLPPAATADFVCVDEGNASPRFIRLTTNNIACDSELIDSTKLCIGAIIQPMANLGDGEEPIPIVHYPRGPLRCSKCMAYVNPFFTFIEQGNAFNCNLCGMRNDVPDDYRCNLDANGYRRDRHDRPELCRGSVEFEVGDEFKLRPIQDPVFLFVIDVSYGSVVSGLVGAAVTAARAAIDAMATMVNPDGSENRSCVGIITYDDSVHFYSLKLPRTEPMMLVMSDVEEPFVPCPPEEICVRVAVEENRALLHSTLDLLASVYEVNKVTENLPCFGAAITAASETLLTLGGGKILIMQSNLPQVGAGKLEHRDQIALYHTDKEKTLQVPQSAFYQTLATKCAEGAITIDLFVCANGYVDLATVSALTEKTGGQVLMYPAFNASKDGLALQRDLYHNVTRVTGYDGIMIVRASAGLKVVEHFGNYYHRKVQEVNSPCSAHQHSCQMELASIDCDKTFGIRVEHEGKLKDKSDACLQCALLYTTASGHRRIRVHTISVPVTSVMSNIFRFADLDAIINLSLKQAVRQLLDSTTCMEAQNALTMACIESLYVYRKFCASATSAGQLILPEPLKLLPLCTLGLVKHPLFQDGLAADERSFLFAFVNSMPCYVSVAFVCPRLFNLTSFEGTACIPDESGRVYLPRPLTLSSESVTSNGLYLLDDGRYMYLYIGSDLPTPLLDQVFNIQGDGKHQAGRYRIRHVPNQPELISSRINVLIGTLRKNKPNHQPLQIISRRPPMTGAGAGPAASPTNRAGWETFESLDENLFFSHLIEDAVHKTDNKPAQKGSINARAPNSMSYIDFLCFIHKRIQAKFL